MEPIGTAKDKGSTLIYPEFSDLRLLSSYLIIIKHFIANLSRPSND